MSMTTRLTVRRWNRWWIDCSALEPLVAYPHLPSNGRKISECAGEAMDQCYIGSCTNGRIEDYRIAAKIIKGKQVQIRTLIVPTTPTVWRQANDEGLLNIFQSAGCVVSAPTCGACLGGFMGVLGAGEKCVSTTNRNFVGRMGDPTSEVYQRSLSVQPRNGGSQCNRRRSCRSEEVFINESA
jgi:3-isopropylmalate/(R)-2-methylmalate dehydratase large subunit